MQFTYLSFIHGISSIVLHFYCINVIVHVLLRITRFIDFRGYLIYVQRSKEIVNGVESERRSIVMNLIAAPGQYAQI